MGVSDSLYLIGLVGLIFHLLDLAKSESVLDLAIETILQVVSGQAGSEVDPQTVNSEHNHVAVVVLNYSSLTLRHIWAMYLLCTNAALIPLVRLKALLSATPTGA